MLRSITCHERVHGGLELVVSDLICVLYGDVNVRERVLLWKCLCHQIDLYESEARSEYKEVLTGSAAQDLMKTIELH